MENLVKNYMVARALVLAVLGCVGCGGDKSPSEECEDLVDLTCDRAVECLPGASGMHAACVHAVEQAGLSCSATKSVKPSYDRCIDQLNEQSCRMLFPIDPDTGDQTTELPAECSGVLVTQSAAGKFVYVVRTNVPPSDPIGDMALRARAVLPSDID
jgi:hypothetical protein